MCPFCFQHRVFGNSLTIGYIPLDTIKEEIDAYVDAGAPVLVVTGESGCGKSALMADWGEV